MPLPQITSQLRCCWSRCAITINSPLVFVVLSYQHTAAISHHILTCYCVRHHHRNKSTVLTSPNRRFCCLNCCHNNKQICAWGKRGGQKQYEEGGSFSAWVEMLFLSVWVGIEYCCGIRIMITGCSGKSGQKLIFPKAHFYCWLMICILTGQFQKINFREKIWPARYFSGILS